jgi:hypothetical protein
MVGKTVAALANRNRAEMSILGGTRRLAGRLGRRARSAMRWAQHTRCVAGSSHSAQMSPEKSARFRRREMTSPNWGTFAQAVPLASVQPGWEGSHAMVSPPEVSLRHAVPASWRNDTVTAANLFAHGPLPTTRSHQRLQSMYEFAEAGREVAISVHLGLSI